MRRKKILWITFWMTMVYWLGGAIGCATDGTDENYKILEDNDTKLNSEPYSDATDADLTNTDMVDSGMPGADTDMDTAAPDTSNVVAPTPPSAPGALAVDNTPQTVEPVGESISTPPPASLTNGMDRSHWNVIHVGPIAGQSAHFPTYARDMNITHDTQRPLATMGFGERIESALDGDRPAGYDATNTWATIAQPGKFVVDSLLFPIHVIMDHPFKTTTSPDAAE